VSSIAPVLLQLVEYAPSLRMCFFRRPIEEVASEVEKRRAELMSKMDSAASDAAAAAVKKSSETHEVAQRKLDQMDKLRSALGMASDTKEGDAFNRELQV